MGRACIIQPYDVTTWSGTLPAGIRFLGTVPDLRCGCTWVIFEGEHLPSWYLGCEPWLFSSIDALIASWQANAAGLEGVT